MIEGLCVGEPQYPGMYVAYIQVEGMPKDFPYAEKKLLMFIDGKWGHVSSDQNYRGKVYAWVGPLPAYKIKSNNGKKKVRA